MELEVSQVPGIHDCFAALPLEVIEALQGRYKTEMFSVTLELRLSNRVNDQGPWYLAWAGAASTSSSIEVSKKLAECVGLPNRARFLVKALSDVAHADTVELEPATEDDWEILELNAGFVEDHILSQVGVLCSDQVFPIWVQGDIVLTLHVISIAPKQVVRLVPGTELIVAPKPRKKPSPGLETMAFATESSGVKAWLRVQEIHSSLMHPYEMDNFSCLVVPTTTMFVSEETAKQIPFIDGQLVVITNVDGTMKQKEESGKREIIKDDNRAVGKVDRNTKVVVLRMVYSNLAAEGHVMLASSLRLFIGAQIHTRIEVKSYTERPTTISSFVVISPINFKIAKRSPVDAINNTRGQDEARDVAADKIYEDTTSEWEKHKEFLRFTAYQSSVQQQKPEGLENGNPSYSHEHQEAKKLFKLWAAAQMNAISECAPGHCSSIPIVKETVMQFLLQQKDVPPTNIARSRKNGTKGFALEANSGGQMKKRAEMLSFLISLHNPEELNERAVSSELELANLASRPYKGMLLFDKKLLETEDFGVVGSMMSGAVPLRFKMGQPQNISSSLEISLEDNKGPILASLTWLKGPASEALSRLQVSLSPEAQAKCCKLGLASPGYVLLHGPPACGKTKLALAIARELEENPSILAHKVMVKCADLVGEQAQAVRAALQDAVFEALRHAPSLIILDDLDMAIPSSSSSENSEPSTSSAVLTEFLSDLLDTLRVYGKNRCGGCVSILALAQAVSKLPAPLCTSGRFDFHVVLPAPATTERAAILFQELEQRRLVCKQDIISETASKCDGYDTADLEVLVDRAVHAAAARLLSLSNQNIVSLEDSTETGNQGAESLLAKQENTQEKTVRVFQRQNFELLKEDFSDALDGFLPVSMRDIAKPGGQVGRLSWEDIGGLNDTCRALQEMLELPVKYNKIFSKAPLRLRSGVLLYGPPGCGKTHVVGVAAAACSLRLISVKGPELLNKYIGASEQGVRDIFAKATAAAPCILFFDEFDAIAPKRGHDNTGVTDRVVNQLLTELDGVEALNGVFVFAATSRPDLLDAALLRPGRLDRLLLCDFPTARERLEILQVLSRKLPLAEDTNLDVVASLTENFSGADLQAVLSDAQLEAVHSFLSEAKIKDGNILDKSGSPIITMAGLRSVLLKARPSVSDRERRRLYDIYELFMSSRSSMAGKARDAKGKRATLA